MIKSFALLLLVATSTRVAATSYGCDHPCSGCFFSYGGYCPIPPQYLPPSYCCGSVAMAWCQWDLDNFNYESDYSRQYDPYTGEQLPAPVEPTNPCNRLRSGEPGVDLEFCGWHRFCGLPMPTKPPTPAPTYMDQPAHDPCDLVSVHMPSSTGGTLSLEIHTDKYSYYTNIDTIVVDIGNDKMEFNKNDAHLENYKINGVAQNGAMKGAASNYGTKRYKDTIAIQNDGCTTSAPCHTQTVEQVSRGEFRVVINPCT